MESARQQIFFMSCDALKKTKNKEKKKKNQWPQPKSAFFWCIAMSEQKKVKHFT